MTSPSLNATLDELPPAKPPFTRRHHAFLAAGFLAFVIYGSLVPFRFRPMAWEEALAAYQKALIFHGFDSRSDLLANILLFIPLSYLLLAAISVDRPRWLSWMAALPVVLFCFLLSGAIEFTQVFFEKRYADINDIIGESIGAGIGAVLWLGFGPRITGWCRKIWSANLGSGLFSLLLPGYLVFLILYQVLPLDLTLSPAEIAHKYRDGKIQLIPYAMPPGDRLEWIEKQCWNLALFCVVGMLWAGRSPATRSAWQGAFRVLGLGLLLAAMITFLKVFVISRYVETGDIITGTLAVSLGWLACRSRIRESRIEDRESPRSFLDPRSSILDLRQSRWSLLFAAAWLAMAIFVNWHPFDFYTDTGVALDRLKNLSWLPFADYLQGSYINFLNQIVRKTLLFVPLGLLLASTIRNRNGFRPWWILALAFAVALILEIGQAFLPSRYPSVTDVLLETCGAGVGFVMGRQALRSQRSELRGQKSETSSQRSEIGNLLTSDL